MSRGGRKTSFGRGGRGGNGGHKRGSFGGFNEPDPSDAYSMALYGEGAPATFSDRDDQSAPSEEELFKKVHDGLDFTSAPDIPIDCSDKSIVPIQSFSKEAGIHDLILKNIEKAKYTNPTPIQKYSIPIGLGGHDLMACAQTGSGKTAAFLVPFLTKILENEPPPRGERYSSPFFLILAPTRELAIQIQKECMKFAHNTWIRTSVVYGGAPTLPQIRQLERGVDVLVATPGRLEDFYNREKVSFANVKYLVLDEADRMLDMGFEKDIRRILQETDMTPVNDRVTSMFSATFPSEIRKLARDFMRNHIFVTIGRIGSAVDSIEQVVKYVEEGDKRKQVLEDIKSFPGRTLVFAETKADADRLARFLFSSGVSCTGIHGDRTQHEREAALASFKAGRLTVLVATDVASRGLDISDVVHVINYDLPAAIDSYVHRIGRTGRAGQKGLATSYFNSGNLGIVKDLVTTLKDTKKEVPSFLMDALMEAFTNKRKRGGSFGRFRGRGGGGRGKFMKRDRPY